MNLTKKLWIQVKDYKTLQSIVNSLLSDYLEKDLIESFGIYDKEVNKDCSFLSDNSFYLTFNDDFDYFSFCKLISDEFKTKMLCWISGNFFYFDDNGFFSNDKNPFDGVEQQDINDEKQDISLNLEVENTSDSNKCNFDGCLCSKENDFDLDEMIDNSQNFYMNLEKNQNSENNFDVDIEMLKKEFLDDIDSSSSSIFDVKENDFSTSLSEIANNEEFNIDFEPKEENATFDNMTCCKDDCCNEECVEDICCSNCSEDFNLCLLGCCNWEDCCEKEICNDECCFEDSNEKSVVVESNDFGLLEVDSEMFDFSISNDENQGCCQMDDNKDVCDKGDSCCKNSKKEENDGEFFEQNYESYFDLLNLNEEQCENCDCSFQEMKPEFLDFSDDKKEENECSEEMCSSCEGCSWDFDENFDHNEILNSQVNNEFDNLNNDDINIEYISDELFDKGELSYHFDCVCEDEVKNESENTENININSEIIDFTDNEEIKETESISTLFDEVNEMKAVEDIFKDIEQEESKEEINQNSLIEEKEYDELFSELDSIEDIKNKDLITAEELEVLLASNNDELTSLDFDNLSQENVDQDSKEPIDFESFFAEITKEDLEVDPSFNSNVEEAEDNIIEEKPIDFKAFFADLDSNEKDNEKEEDFSNEYIFNEIIEEKDDEEQPINLESFFIDSDEEKESLNDFEFNNDVVEEEPVDFESFFTEITKEELNSEPNFDDNNEEEPINFESFFAEMTKNVDDKETEIISSEDNNINTSLTEDDFADKKFNVDDFNIEELYQYQTSENDSTCNININDIDEEENLVCSIDSANDDQDLICNINNIKDEEELVCNINDINEEDNLVCSIDSTNDDQVLVCNINDIEIESSLQENKEMSLHDEVKDFFSDLPSELSNIPDFVEARKPNEEEIVIEDISINSDLESLDLSSAELFETEFLSNELNLDEEMNNQFSTLNSSNKEDLEEDLESIKEEYQPDISSNKIVSDKKVTSDLQKFLEELRLEKEKLRLKKANLEKKTAKVKNMFNQLQSSNFNN